MLRMSRALGLAFLVALALTAVMASAAQAAPEFHVENASSTMPAEIKGEQMATHAFGTENGLLPCNQVNFTGTSSVISTTSQILRPEFSGCIASGFPANVTVNSPCTYRFNLVKNSSPPTANIDICSTGGSITIVTIGGCTTTVGSQNAKAHVVFSNTTPLNTPKDIDANTTISGITYTANGCGHNGTFNTGTTNDEWTFRAYTEGVQQGMWVA